MQCSNCGERISTKKELFQHYDLSQECGLKIVESIKNMMVIKNECVNKII